MRGSLRKFGHMTVGVWTARSLPTIIVVVRDVATFVGVALSAAVIDKVLELVLGRSTIFGIIRPIAAAFLGFIALAYLVESAALVVFDVGEALRDRWNAWFTANNIHDAVNTSEGPSTVPFTVSDSEVPSDD